MISKEQLVAAFGNAIETRKDEIVRDREQFVKMLGNIIESNAWVAGGGLLDEPMDKQRSLWDGLNDIASAIFFAGARLKEQRTGVPHCPLCMAQMEYTRTQKAVINRPAGECSEEEGYWACPVHPDEKR